MTGSRGQPEEPALGPEQLIQAMATAMGAAWQNSVPIPTALAGLGRVVGVETKDLTELGALIERVRREIDTAQRGEAALQRLVQTAHHLLASPAPEELLAIVVEATRDLVRSDVAHLNIERGREHFDTIRATTGERTEAFRRQRTPPGAGLTGLVMRSRQPYVTTDYINDTRLNHDAAGDYSVTADGLVTMAAVPMVRADEVVGVLIASWRRKTDVPARDINILSALASLAGLAVTNARLRTESDAARAQIERDNRELARNNDLLRWGAEAHDRLTALLYSGSNVSELTLTLHEVLGADVMLVDPLGHDLGSAVESSQRLPTRERLAKFEDSDRVRVVENAAATTWVTMCRSGEHTLAVLLVIRDELDAVEQRTVERAAAAIGFMLSTRDALAEAEYRSVAEALADLARGNRVDSAVARIRSWGFDTSAPSIVVIVRTAGTDRLDHHAVARRYAQEHRGIIVGVDENTVILRPGSDPDGVANELLQRFSDRDSTVLVGADGPASSPAAIRAAYQRAVRCVDALGRLHGAGVATVLSLGFIGQLLAGGNRKDLEHYVDDRLGPLTGHGDERSVELLQTLASYLHNNGSLQRAAKSLSIHPNTVLQRLQRIESALDIDLQAPGVRTEFDLALRTRALLDQISPAEPTD